MLNLNTLFHSFTQNPKSLFLLDGVGATVTALLLGVVLRHFQPFLGMTMPVLTALAVVALVFCVYSLSCSMRLP